MSNPAQNWKSGPITVSERTKSYAKVPVRSINHYKPNLLGSLRRPAKLVAILTLSGLAIFSALFSPQLIDRVLGVEAQGGSAVTLDRVLDDNFNLSLAGYLEGSRLRATATSGSPLTVLSSSLVSNLNADLLDGQHGSYYLAWPNFTGQPIVLSSLDGVSNSGGNIDLIAGSNVTITPDDVANTITITSSASASGWMDDGTVVRLVTATDQVGVGTASPLGTFHVQTGVSGSAGPHTMADDLVVENSTDGGISILTPNANVGYLIFGSPSSNINGYFGYNNTSQKLTLAISGVPRFDFYASSLNFLQATTISTPGASDLTLDPGGKLDVFGSIDATGSINTDEYYSIDDDQVLSADASNTFLGHLAGVSNTTGDWNTFSGYEAGYNNTIGYSNTFFGYQAGFTNAESEENTFLGSEAGYSNTFGYDNTFSGYQAGYSNTEGSFNTFLGVQAGATNTTGNWNTFVGYQAGGGGATNTGDRNTFSGYQAGGANTIGDDNTFFGYQAGRFNTEGIYNTFSGYQAGYSNTTANANTFSGYEAGRSNTEGYDNTFFGYQAGRSNLTGDSNTFLGRTAGFSNTGNLNVFIGNKAGYNETGSELLYIDSSDTATPLIYGDFNSDRLAINGGSGTASPDGTLHVHTASAGVVTADANGRGLIVENSSNTGISILVPNNAQSILFFGAVADSSQSFISNHNDNAIMQIDTIHDLVIEAGAGKAIIINESGVDTDFRVEGVGQVNALFVQGNTGNVGIRTDNPQAPLEVNGNLNVVTGNNYEMGGWAIIGSDGTGQDNYLFSAQTSLSIRNWQDTTNLLTVLNGGDVGIGRTPAANDLEVEGTASKTAAGDWLANSDIRIKTDVQTIENALGVIDQLRPVRFKYTDEYIAQHPSLDSHYYYNFIAQEFQEVFPDSVKDSGEGYLQLDAYVVRPYLVAAVQELDAKIRSLEALVDSDGDLAQEVGDGTASIDVDIPDQLNVLGIEAKAGVFETITSTISAVFEKLTAKVAEIASAVVEELTVSKITVKGPALGTGTIPAGETSVAVSNTSVTDSSHVFLTPKDPVAFAVSEIEEGESFTVLITEPQDKDVDFSYWIVEE